MDVKLVLAELGLGEGEIKVYLALLKLGSSPVSALKEETNLHRTTIYDFIEKLLNKGLVNYVLKGNVKFYKATHPQKLVEFLQEKAEKLNHVMPQLIQMSDFHKDDLKVEVFKGKEGYKTMLGHVLKEGKDMIGMGFDEERFEKMIPDTMRWYFRQTKEKNIHEYVFVKEGAKFLYPHDTIHYKYLPEEFFNPNPTMTFGNKVAILLWNPLSTILIENKELADAYKKWFEMLWNQKTNLLKGNEALKRIYDEQIKTFNKKDELLVFGCSSHIPPFFMNYFNNYYNEEITKTGAKVKIIFDENAHDLINPCLEAKWNVKTLPKKYISPVEVDIWRDKIAIIIWKKEPLAFFIEDKEVAEGFRAFFNIQWDIANNIKLSKNNSKNKQKSLKKLKLSKKTK